MFILCLSFQGNKKDKKKAAKGAAAKIDIFKTVSRDTMSEYVEYEEMRDKMAHVVDHLKQQLLEKISLRSNPGEEDWVWVEGYLWCYKCDHDIFVLSFNYCAMCIL